MDIRSDISPAIWYARIFGVVLAIIGIAGLFVTTSQDAVDQIAGLDVNLLHNLVHLATGLIGIVVGFSMLYLARAYSLALGVVYGVLGIWGLIEGSNFDPFGIFVRIDTADSILHLAIGVVGIAAWALTSADVEEGTVA